MIYKFRTAQSASDWLHRNQQVGDVCITESREDGMFCVDTVDSDEASGSSAEQGASSVDQNRYSETLSVDYRITDSRINDGNFGPATEGSAGIDLMACIESPLLLPPMSCSVLVSVGFAMHIGNPNFCAYILPRSGLGHGKGLVIGNLVGLIDSDYSGEIRVSCWNRGQDDITINPLDRIAQMVFLPCARPTFRAVNVFEASKRGSGGFGSSGI